MANAIDADAARAADEKILDRMFIPQFSLCVNATLATTKSSCQFNSRATSKVQILSTKMRRIAGFRPTRSPARGEDWPQDHAGHTPEALFNHFRRSSPADLQELVKLPGLLQDVTGCSPHIHFDTATTAGRPAAARAAAAAPFCDATHQVHPAQPATVLDYAVISSD
jgi:hypothetical protein